MPRTDFASLMPSRLCIKLKWLQEGLVLLTSSRSYDLPLYLLIEVFLIGVRLHTLVVDCALRFVNSLTSLWDKESLIPLYNENGIVYFINICIQTVSRRSLILRTILKLELKCSVSSFASSHW